jgi:hypothetical protein
VTNQNDNNDEYELGRKLGDDIIEYIRTRLKHPEFSNCERLMAMSGVIIKSLAILRYFVKDEIYHDLVKELLQESDNIYAQSIALIETLKRKESG